MPSTAPVYTNIPDIPTGYPINGKWEVILPIARVNEITNPSIELGTTGYTTGAGALAQTFLKQYHGSAAAIYTPSAALTDGFFYSTLVTTTNQIRAISCKWLGQPNVPYALTLATSAGVDLVTFPFRATGRWQWLWLYWKETGGATRRIYFRKNGSTDVHPYYIDGVQSEVINAGEFVSTYLDGDMVGFLPNQAPPYGWYGTPHASSSFRTALTRTGGHVIPLKRLGLLITAVMGLGLSTPQNINTDYGLIDGGYPNYTRKPIDQFSLGGNISWDTYYSLRRNRGVLAGYFDRDAIPLDQPLRLRYTHTDDCENLQSDSASIDCKYVGGWEGQTNNHVAQQVTMAFETYVPFITSEGEAGASLNTQSSVTSIDVLVQRAPSGTWSAPGNSVTAAVVTGNAFAIGPDGALIVGGLFPDINSVANTVQIARLDPLTTLWTAFGTGGAGAATSVNSIAFAPDGTFVAGGSFTSMGGVANTANLARWNGAAWVSITPLGSADAAVTAVLYDNLGQLYIGGAFANINGVAIRAWAKQSGATFVAIGAGFSIGAGVSAAVVDPANNIYIGGIFTVPSTNIVKLSNDGVTFSALGSGLNNAVRALALDDANNLYAGGQFTASGSITLLKVAKWNGVQWFPLGSGIVGTSASALAYYQGLLYIGGIFTTAGGITPPDSLVVWNGSSYVYPDIDIPGATATVNALKFGRDGTLYAGLNTGTAVTTGSAAGVTTVNNPGTAPAYPVFVIKGPSSGTSRIFSITNPTTGRAIYLNLTINAGETVTLNFDPANLLFTSNFVPGGDVSSTILPGSSTGDFFLTKGNNTINFFAAVSTVTATIRFHPQYLMLDDLQ